MRVLSKRTELEAARFVEALILEGVERTRAASLVQAFALSIAGKPQPSGMPNGHHASTQSILDFYTDQYQMRVGEPPAFDIAQACGIAARFLRHHSTLVVQQRLVAYFHSTDPLIQAAGYSWPMFAARWGALAVAAAVERQQQDEEFRRAGWRTQCKAAHGGACGTYWQHQQRMQRDGTQ